MRVKKIDGELSRDEARDRRDDGESFLLFQHFGGIVLCIAQYIGLRVSAARYGSLQPRYWQGFPIVGVGATMYLSHEMAAVSIVSSRRSCAVFSEVIRSAIPFIAWTD